MERNPREVFLVEGHTDAVGSDVDNLSLSDRRAQSGAAVLTRDQWDEPMSTLDVSIGLFMLPLATGAVHSVLHLLVGAVSGRPGRTMATAEVAATE